MHNEELPRWNSEKLIDKVLQKRWAKKTRMECKVMLGILTNYSLYLIYYKIILYLHVPGT